MKTYSEARNALPADAKWSCSFGYPGEGGYSEYWRVDGKRFEVSNGSGQFVFAPFVWTVVDQRHVPRLL